MRKAHRGISRIDALAAGTGGTKRVDANILGFELDLHLIGFRQHGHRDRGGVDAPLLLCLRHTLDPMHAAFVLQLAVNPFAADQRSDIFQTAYRGFARRSYFHLPSAGFREARIHAEDFFGEQSGFVAAGSGANFEHDVAFVVGIFRQQQNLQLFFDLGQLRRQFQNLVGRHLAEIGVGFILHPLRFGQVLADLFPLPIFRDRFFQIVAGFRDLAVLRGIVEDRGVHHLRGQLFKAPLNPVQSMLIVHAQAIISSPPCLASSAIAPFKAWIATAACESSGGLVVMRWSHRPGVLSIPISVP